MKKTSKFFAILAVLLFAASCQNTDIDNGQAIDNGSFTVTATIVAPDATRVTYDVDNETSHTITPAWTVGDEIIGFDDADHTFTFTVASVDGSGRATLDANGYVPGAATKLYAIYYPGKTVSDFTGTGASTKLAVDLTTQGGGALNDASPVLMCATADITAGGATLDFENQTAIIGVTKFKLPAAATVTSVSVDGLITSGTFKLDGGALVLTPGTTPSTITATGSWATGEGNICTTALYFATLPTASAKIALRANDGANDYGNLASIAATDITAGNYYYMQKNLGAPVADVNGVKYGTIDDAFAAANRATTATTVTVLADCAAAGRLNILSAAGSGAVTLDLNGRTLSMPSDQIHIEGRTLTILDNSSANLAEQGTIDCDATGCRAMYLGASATLNFQGGTLTHDSGANNYGAIILHASTANFTGGRIISSKFKAVSVCDASTANFSGNVRVISYSSYAVSVEEGTANIEDGFFARYAPGGYVVYTADPAAVVNISGGTLTNFEAANAYSVAYASSSGGTVTVTGGNFNSYGIYPVSANGTAADKGVAYVTGGCFNKAIPPKYAKNSSSDEYVNVLNTNPSTAETYPFTMAAASSTPNVAVTTQSTNTWNHGSVESAFKCADVRAYSNGASTVTLQNDVTATSAMAVGAGNSYQITMDLNGHSISSALSPVITAASDFVFSDNVGGGELATTGATALDVTGGTTTIATGSLVAATNAATLNGGTLTITGGYFYGGGVADVAKNSGTSNISGGWFRSEPAAGLLTSGYSPASGSTTYKARDYAYQVVGVVATVNGESYTSWSDAVSAANSYSGAADTVKLQIQLDITGASAAALNNASSKPILLDLNGHTVSTTVSSFITTTKTLVITDTSVSKGKITGSSTKVIDGSGSTNTAKITIRECVIECTVSSADYNVPVLFCGGKTQWTVTDAVITATGKVTGIYINNDNCKVTVGGSSEITSGLSTAKGFYAIFNQRGTLTIDGGSFFTKGDSGSSNVSAVRVGDLSTAKLTVNDGYFYGNEAKSISNGGAGKITLNGGYLNLEPSGTVTYGTGTDKELKTLSPAITHRHNTTGVDYSYGYQIADK